MSSEFGQKMAVFELEIDNEEKFRTDTRPMISDRDKERDQLWELRISSRVRAP
jgi:hypothetical protein